jgi:hypothetical protein
MQQRQYSLLFKLICFVGIVFFSAHLQTAMAFTPDHTAVLHNLHDSDNSYLNSENLGAASIPGFAPYFDIYCYWDTLNLDPYNFNFKDLGGTLQLPILESDCGFMLPVVGKISSGFGYRWGRPHAGVDIELHTGDTVNAAFDGVVRMSRWYYGYGNCVVIRHHNGLETLYGHLSKRIVNPGDLVNAGQVIGLGGSTGYSTGPHLHFETRFMGKAFNPQNFIDFKTDSLLKDTLVFDTNSFAAPKPVYYNPYYRYGYRGYNYRKPQSYARKSTGYKK